MKTSASRLTYRSLSLLTGLILSISLSGVSYAADDIVMTIENHEYTTTVNSNVVFTDPSQPDANGNYTTGPGIGGNTGNGTVITFPNLPGSPGTITIGGVTDGPEYSTIFVPSTGGFYLDSEEYSITVGDTFDTAAFAKDISGAVHNVTSQVQYFSENPSLLQVDQQGNITGLNPGVAHVTAWYNGLKYTATVLVVKPYSAH